MSRVKLDVLKPWIGQRVANFLNGIEDDVVVEFVFNQLEDKDPDPRKMQINLVINISHLHLIIMVGKFTSSQRYKYI